MRLPGLWRLPLGKVPEVSVDELHRWLELGHPVQLLDARTRLEYRGGTIGAADYAPLSETPDVLQRLDLDPSQPVVMLCLSGHRSRPGTRWLRLQGFEAFSLQGGITAWKRAGLPLSSPNSKAGD